MTDQRAVDRFRQAVAEARADGTVYTGGEVLSEGDLARGFYVEPTVVGNLPADHRLFRDELFVPFTAVCPVDSLDEALSLSNAVVYGLTAGIYSEVPEEVEQFLDEIHTGVLYVNRRAALRRLEGLRLYRQGRPGPVLRGPVPARAVAHHRRLIRGHAWPGRSTAPASVIVARVGPYTRYPPCIRSMQTDIDRRRGM